MAKRLIKIAKELNVGTGTIVDFLTGAGFDIDNKPTAKVTDDMEDALRKEFSGSMNIKERADQLVIGTRPKKEEEVLAAPKPIFKTPAPKPEPVVESVPEPEPEIVAVPEPTPEPEPEPTPPPAPEPVAEAPQEEATPAPAKEEPESTTPGLKVLGKIDLTEVGKKPKKKKAPKPKAEAPKEKAPQKEASKPKEEAPVAEKAPEEKSPTVPEEGTLVSKAAGEAVGDKEPEKMVRAKTPELRGLKILGKVDTSKLKTDTKKKKKTTTDKKAGEGDANKRKRKRKRVPSAGGGGGPRGRDRRGGGRGRSQKEEVREVSQKEIEDKIKATMARLSGGGKKKRQKMRRENREEKREKQELLEMEKQTDKLQLTEFVSVQELANLMDKPVADVITTCLNLGVIVSINQRLDAEIIELVAEEFGHEVEFISVTEEADEDEEIVDDPADLKPRAPIVTVMGHVDHGKTSLLDFIRNAKVAEGEAGGITQHIGAYEVKVGDDDKRVTFLDTPGHEAFTAMRARGAKVTDIAIIIIAADDSIMPQTREAISHAQAAGVPIVFAINKIDKDGAQPDKIKQELAGMNLLIEEWGGTIQSQDISAKTGQGIDELLEKVTLEAEMLELQANPDREASGVVLEASLDKGRGYVTKILVQTGTLDIGDPIVSGEFSGKVKAMFNERGKRVKQVGPSTPVLVLGLSGAPQAGERFKETVSEPEARQIANRRAQIVREQTNRATKRISLDEIGRRLALGNFKELNLIVKGDMDGSIEALSDSLIKLSQETVQVNVIHKAVGQIIESDVLLASASDAIIVGFQVRPSIAARRLAEQEGVEINTYSIIYKAIEEIKLAIEGLLEPIQEEAIVAQVEVREVYKISKVGTVAGCYVQEGKITRNTFVRIIRDGIVVYPTKEGAHAELSSLKRFKDDAKEVKNGMECGITIKNFNDIKVGDVIEGFEINEIKQTLK